MLVPRPTRRFTGREYDTRDRTGSFPYQMWRGQLDDPTDASRPQMVVHDDQSHRIISVLKQAQWSTVCAPQIGICMDFRKIHGRDLLSEMSLVMLPQ